MIRLLYISYHFPPQGGAGVQRSLKFIKHLPSFNIHPIVLTNDNEKSSHWTPKDESLMADLPSSVTIHRLSWLKSKERERELNSPSGQLFLDEAELAGKGAQAIFVTMSPFEDALIAIRLSKRLKIPWIADLRDPWALDEFQTYRTAWHRIKERIRMKDLLQSASTIIMNTPEAENRLKLTFPMLNNSRIVSITNGYDNEDFSKKSLNPTGILKGKFNIIHTGTFHTALGLRQKRQKLLNRVLGRTTPGVDFLPRSPYYLLKAIAQIRKDFPHIAKNINIVFAGASSPEEEQAVKSHGLNDIVTITGYVQHETSVAYLQQADLLFLPMHAISKKRRSTIVPGKLYEYLASGKPILAAIPEGDAQDFLIQSGNCYSCQPNDIDAIKDSLITVYKNWQSNEAYPLQNKTYIERFERKALTKQLAKHIETTTISNKSNSRSVNRATAKAKNYIKLRQPNPKYGSTEE